MTLLNNSVIKRFGIFCFYDKNGHAARFLDGFLAALTQNLTDLVIIVNGKIDDETRKLFSKYTDTVMVRENKGLDVAAYKQALLTIGWEKLETYDEVLCLNDTIMGPVYPFDEMFETMSHRDVDFWGITAYAGETVNGEKIPTHLQAYWHAYRRDMVSSQAFHEYWENMPLWSDYAEVTRKHEMTFTEHFAKLGFKWDSYIDWRKYKGYSSYPLLYMPMQLLRDDRCPVFKRRSFFVDYSAYFDQTAGQPALDLYDFLKNETDYDVDLIWDAILPNYNIDDIRKALHLDYVLPAATRNPRNGADVRSAFIYHIYFLDLSLPAIRRKLIEAIDCSQDDVAFLILKFFDEYTREVRKHMDYEEKTVFKYVDALIAGNAPKNYQISTFSKHHDQVGEKLTELKNIIIKYCPAKANENLLNAALFDIYACEEGLESHCKIEDYIFVPAILNLERRMMENEK